MLPGEAISELEMDIRRFRQLHDSEKLRKLYDLEKTTMLDGMMSEVEAAITRLRELCDLTESAIEHSIFLSCDTIIREVQNEFDKLYSTLARWVEATRDQCDGCRCVDRRRRQ